MAKSVLLVFRAVHFLRLSISPSSRNLSAPPLLPLPILCIGDQPGFEKVAIVCWKFSSRPKLARQ